ncbi:MAG: DUF924 family protein [Limimaricola sp.]|uniref:DUF924 family protein n=1 Tax=Limimaricola sp. TaxID=2211665 RepID=UPI001DFE7332|nr:DUF924 family protein [Limimaricola sp.]MBI1418396.1 DUF924 family protein [Limimaricola sp.]
MTPDTVLQFWLDEVGPAGWYAAGEALDNEVRARFAASWDEMMEGAFGLWLTYPGGALAYLILTDQFPRNMFRDTGKSFASDAVARAAAKAAIDHDWDLMIHEPARQFFYMPLMHSETLTDQDRAVRLFCARMPETGENNRLHARAHRDVIRRFGRFPTRNAALGRVNTPEEAAWLRDGGYGATLRALETATA